MTSNLKTQIITALPKDLCLDLDDRLRAEAVKAFNMVRDHSGLDFKRGRALEGQARFRMMEKGFQEVCELHGGLILESGIIPGSDMKVFQPFMRFDGEKNGVILGLAAMPDPKVMPNKNKSRMAGVSLNYNLSPRLDFDGKEAKEGDIFVLFLIARDRLKGGKIEEVAIGVIGAEYDNFIHYEELSVFMTGYVEPIEPEDASEADVFQKQTSAVSLKKDVGRYVPPEEQESAHVEKNIDASKGERKD